MEYRGIDSQKVLDHWEERLLCLPLLPHRSSLWAWDCSSKLRPKLGVPERAYYYRNASLRLSRGRNSASCVTFGAFLCVCHVPYIIMHVQSCIRRSEPRPLRRVRSCSQYFGKLGGPVWRAASIQTVQTICDTEAWPVNDPGVPDFRMVRPRASRRSSSPEELSRYVNAGCGH
jgi:hypothetical protein